MEIAQGTGPAGSQGNKMLSNDGPLAAVDSTMASCNLGLGHGAAGVPLKASN